MATTIKRTMNALEIETLIIHSWYSANRNNALYLSVLLNCVIHTGHTKAFLPNVEFTALFVDVKHC